MLSLSRQRQSVAYVLGVVALAFLANAAVVAQEQSLKGAAALAHPAVQQAVKVADLITAGKIDEAVALSTKSGQSEWKSMPAADRKDMGAFLAKRTPTAKAFSDAVRANGELNIIGNTGVLAFFVGQDRGAAYFDLEGGSWRVSNGPMVFTAAPEPVNEVRVENADILEHAIGPLALQYLDLIHTGRIDDAMKLTTTSAQAKWKTEPASEQAESLAYQQKNLPTRAAAETGLKAGRGFRGVLIIEDDMVATLNFITSEQKPAGPDTTNYSTTTQTMGFEKENGQWRVGN